MDAPSVTAAIGSDRPVSIKEVFGLVDASLDWDDLASLVAGCELPVVAQGPHAPRGRRARDRGGRGGRRGLEPRRRQLDGVPATIDALPAVAEAVDGRVPVLVDGGVRRGTDVLVALALGADAVLAGRPGAVGAGGGRRGRRAGGARDPEGRDQACSALPRLPDAGRRDSRARSARASFAEAGNRRQERIIAGSLRLDVGAGAKEGQCASDRSHAGGLGDVAAWQRPRAPRCCCRAWIRARSRTRSGAGLPQFEGEAVEADPFSFPPTPQHPLMAPNGLSNIHVDALPDRYEHDPPGRWARRRPTRPSSPTSAPRSRSTPRGGW